MPTTLHTKAQGLEFGNLVELFIVDATALGVEDVFYWHNDNVISPGQYHFQGLTYTYRPFQITGFEYKIGQDSPLPRPHAMVSNIGYEISALCLAFKDLIGAKITRKRTYAIFLDGGSNPDPTQEFTPDIYYIDRRVSETQEVVEFELISAIDFENVLLPRRQVLASACRWIYRGPDCGYAGPPVGDAFGNAINHSGVDKGAFVDATVFAAHDYGYKLVNGTRRYYAALVSTTGVNYLDPTKFVADVCAKGLVGGCKLRFGPGSPNPTASLPTAAFPAAARLPNIR